MNRWFARILLLALVPSFRYLRDRPAFLSRVALLIATGCCAPVALANATYCYTGPNFTGFSDNPSFVNPYSGNDFVSGCLTLDALLPFDSPLMSYAGHVVSFSFSDGLNTLSSADATPAVLDAVNLGTTAGHISLWQVYVSEPKPGSFAGYTIQTQSTPFNYDNGSTPTSNGFFVTTGYVHANGSWTGATAAATVPEPATLALLGLGIAAIGFSQRRKVN